MGYILGQLFGGTITCLILTALFNKVLSKFIEKHDKRFYIACLCSLALATILSGLGDANGENPNFMMAFLKYLTPQLLVYLLFSIKRNKQTPTEKDPYKLARYKVVKSED